MDRQTAKMRLDKFFIPGKGFVNFVSGVKGLTISLHVP